MPKGDEVASERRAKAGMRWALVRDDRLTNRLRTIQIPLDAPDPVDPGDSPEMIARTRALVDNLLGQYAVRDSGHDGGGGTGCGRF